MKNFVIVTNLYKDPDLKISNQIAEYIKTFDRFNIEAIKLENGYNIARNEAEEVIAIIDEFLFLVEKKQKVDVGATLKLLIRNLNDVAKDKYFATNYEDKLNAFVKSLEEVKKDKSESSQEVVDLCGQIRAMLAEMLAQPQYNFFRIGYYVYKNPEADLSQMPANEANEMAYKFLMEDFMTAFMGLEKAAVEYAFK